MSDISHGDFFDVLERVSQQSDEIGTFKARVETLEAENAKLREELQHHYGSSDCSCEPWEVSDG